MRKRLIFLVLLVCLSTWLWYRLELRPVDAASKKEVGFVIAKGESVNAIAAHLAQAGLIRSPLAMKWYVKMHAVQSTLQAGTYTLRVSQSVPDIITELQAGKVDEISITIPEGYTVADIDALMAAKGFGKSGDITHCARTCDFSTFDFLPTHAFTAGVDLPIGTRLEGYLFPDTYKISTSQYVPKFFLERLLGTFRKKVVTDRSDDIAASGHSLQDIVIMASLIEEETRHDSERPTVAGILWKRLSAPMPLGVDATVRYGVQKPRATALTATDLDADTLYNSRKRSGLPPTPIANAGLSAIDAALHPQASAFWYYLHDADGTIHYAKTNDEHNRNKLKYLR